MEPDTGYIEVAVALPVYRTFTYSVPESFVDVLAPGKRVLVPFGRRRVTGYIFGQQDRPENRTVKPILDILDERPLFPAAMVSFFNWIADYYKYPIGEVVKNALPGGINAYEYSLIAITDKGRSAVDGGYQPSIQQKVLEQLLSGPRPMNKLLNDTDRQVTAALLRKFERRGWITRKWELSGSKTRARLERFVRLNDTALAVDGLSTSRQRILEILAVNGEMAVKKLKEAVPTAAALIKPLERAGYLTIEHKRVYRDPFGESIKPDIAPILNREQQLAV